MRGVCICENAHFSILYTCFTAKKILILRWFLDKQ